MSKPGPAKERVLPSPKDAAAEIKQKNAAMFAAIQPEELLNMRWEKPDKYDKCPNVSKMVDNWNQIQIAVRDDILLADSPQKQKEMYAHYVNLMKESTKIGDFHAVSAIYMGLQCGPISRLEKALGNNSTQKIMKDTSTLLSLSNNKKNLRTAQKKAVKKGVIPNIQLTFGDLTSSNEIALPLSKALQHNAIVEDGVKKFQQHQPAKAKISSVLGDWPTSSIILTEAQAFARSEQVKPRGKDTLQEPDIKAADFITASKAAQSSVVAPAPAVVKTPAMIDAEKAAAQNAREAKITSNVAALGFTKLGTDEQGGSKSDRKANSIYREILSTEASYQASMDVLSIPNMVSVVNAFPQKPQKGEMTRDEGQQFLEKFEAVKRAEVTLSQAFLEPDPKAWAKAINDATQAYAEYAIVYDKFTITEGKHFPPAAKEAFEKLQTAAGSSNPAKIEAILIQPVQRGPRLNLMFADLAKTTAAVTDANDENIIIHPAHIQHADILAVHETTKEFNETLNRSIKDGKYIPPVAPPAPQVQPIPADLEGFDAAADEAASKAPAMKAPVPNAPPKKPERPPRPNAQNQGAAIAPKQPEGPSPRAKNGRPTPPPALVASLERVKAQETKQADKSNPPAPPQALKGILKKPGTASDAAPKDVTFGQEQVHRIPTRSQEAKMEQDFARVARKGAPPKDLPIPQGAAFEDKRRQLHEARLAKEATKGMAKFADKVENRAETTSAPIVAKRESHEKNIAQVKEARESNSSATEFANDSKPAILRQQQLQRSQGVKDLHSLVHPTSPSDQASGPPPVPPRRKP